MVERKPKNYRWEEEEGGGRFAAAAAAEGEKFDPRLRRG